MRNANRRVEPKEDWLVGNRGSPDAEHGYLDLLAGVAGEHTTYQKTTKPSRTVKRARGRRNEFMISGGCHEEEETTGSDEHATFVVADQKNAAESQDPAQERRKRLKPYSARHAPVPSSQRSRHGARSEGAVGGVLAKTPLDGFASFATKYRDMLKYADEAEAVYSMVALTQAKGSAWAEGQGTSAPVAYDGKGGAANSGGQAMDSAHQERTGSPAAVPGAAEPSGASHTEGAASDTSTKSAPAAKAVAKPAPITSCMQPGLRPIMPGMMLAPMPMPLRPTGGQGHPGMSLPMVPPPFPFPGTLMTMPGVGPSMAPFMPPWAYPPMFGAMPMPMVGPGGQAMMPAATGPQGMSLMALPPGAPYPPGMMLGMPPYMAAMQPAGSGGPMIGMGMPVASMAAAGGVAMALPPPVAAPVASAPIPAASLPAGVVAAAAATPVEAFAVPASAPSAAAAVGVKVLEEVSQLPGTPGGLATAVGQGNAASLGAVVEQAATVGSSGEAQQDQPRACSELLQGQLAGSKLGQQTGELQQLEQQGLASLAAPAEGAAQGACYPAGHVATAAKPAVSTPAAAAAGPGLVLDEAAIHVAIEQLNVAELKSWVLSRFCEDVYLMLLDVWRPDSPKVRDAIWAWRLHVQQPRPNGAEPDYRAFLVSLFGLEKLLQVSFAAQQRRPSLDAREGLPCSCAASDGAARLRMAAAAVASMPPRPAAPVDG